MNKQIRGTGLSQNAIRMDPHHPVSPGNVYEALDVGGDFLMSAQVYHSRRRSFRVRDDHANDVAVFRFEVFEHYVHVYDVCSHVAVNGLAG